MYHYNSKLLSRRNLHAGWSVLSDEVMGGKRAKSVCSFRSSSSERRRPWSRGRNEDEDEDNAKAAAADAAAGSERIAMVDLRRSPVHRPRKPRWSTVVARLLITLQPRCRAQRSPLLCSLRPPIAKRPLWKPAVCHPGLQWVSYGPD